MPAALLKNVGLEPQLNGPSLPPRTSIFVPRRRNRARSVQLPGEYLGEGQGLWGHLAFVLPKKLPDCFAISSEQGAWSGRAGAALVQSRVRDTSGFRSGFDSRETPEMGSEKKKRRRWSFRAAPETDSGLELITEF